MVPTGERTSTHVVQGQDRDSTVYVYVDVTVPAGVDLTGDSCQIAFIPTGSRPTSGDWVAATLQAGNVIAVLVGDYNNSAGVTLSNCTAYPCQLDVWVQITDSPERPEAFCGTWTVT